MIKFALILLLVGMVLVGMIVPVHADSVPFGFVNITNNNATNAQIGEAQLFVDVVSFDQANTLLPGNNLTSNQVLFVFRNTGPDPANIAEVYFDDGSLLGIASLIDADDGVGGHAGVDFTAGSASPGDLPGGQTIGFQVTAGFLADTDSGSSDNSNPKPSGVNPGEFLGIIFNLQSGQTFADVISQLESGALRIGIHVRSIGETLESESFVNNPNPVPEPASLVLALSSILGPVGFAAWRRRKQGA